MTLICLPSVPRLSDCLASLDHRIHFGCVGLVIDDAPADFNPSMGLERNLLSADDHLRRHAVPFQQARRSSRSLQAAHLFPVADACQVDRRADSFSIAARHRICVNNTIANLRMQVRESPTAYVEIEVNQL